MNPVYSVIIPVYNAEKYLDACVTSVLSQDCAKAFEIILVNDGSKDGSAAICDRYAAQNERITAIHQLNQGVSVARNQGIAAAKGQYILFLDSDDVWDPKLLERVECVAAKNADMIEFGCCRFDEDVVISRDIPSCISAGESGLDYVARHEKAGLMVNVSACMVVFRRQFLMENELRFPLNIGYGEDFYFCMQCLKRAQSVFTIPEALYWYRMNQASVTHTPSVKTVRDLLTVSAEIYRMFPGSLLADNYCLRIWRVENLKREDICQLEDLLQENRKILKQVRGFQARLARCMYCIFGWYGGAKALRVLADLRHFRKK